MYSVAGVCRGLNPDMEKVGAGVALEKSLEDGQWVATSRGVEGVDSITALGKAGLVKLRNHTCSNVFFA